MSADRKGIDTAAATVVHELAHKAIYELRLPPNGHWFGLPDTDGDEIPDNVEVTFGTDPHTMRTWPDFPVSNDAPMLDQEVYCERRAQNARAVPARDWANPGKNSKNPF